MLFRSVLLAVILRKGIFPLHGWVVGAFTHGPLLPVVLLLNGHMGALLLARSELVELSGLAHHALGALGVIAVITALIASVRAFSERAPRRAIAFLFLSQTSFLLAGLTTANAEGVTGSLVHWLVLSAASTGLVGVLRAVEVRVGDGAMTQDHLGLAVKAPRLAAFFILCGPC